MKDPWTHKNDQGFIELFNDIEEAQKEAEEVCKDPEFRNYNIFEMNLKNDRSTERFQDNTFNQDAEQEAHKREVIFTAVWYDSWEQFR